jgi:hypothetical protein
MCLHLLSLPIRQYGFSKVRKGPDTDMYAHSSFVRNRPELLCHLRKCTSASRSKVSFSSYGGNGCSSCDESDSGNSTGSHEENACTAGTAMESSSPVVPPRTLVHGLGSKYNLNQSQSWLSILPGQPSLSPKVQCLPSRHFSMMGNPGGTGRLDLLALAVEHAT